MDSSQDINMVIDPLENLFDIGDNYDEVRGRSLEMSAHKPRSSSISSSKCDEEYHIQVKRESDRMVEDESVNSIGSICIKYATQEGQNNQVSKVADSTSNTRQQCVPTVNLPLTSLMMKTWSTSNLTMTPIRLWTLSLGMETSVLYPCMGLWSI